MDILSIVGVIMAFGAILLGQYLEGGHIESLINVPAIIIVFFGTLGASLVETPFKIFIHALKILRWVVFPPRISFQEGIETLLMWANVVRKEGLLGLEGLIDSEENEFAKKSLGLLVDGGESSIIKHILENDLNYSEKKDLLAVKVYEGMGGYCPTIGIIGAVLGLIHVMGNLSDPSKLGGGIAVAFVATVYGVSLANIIFLPVANKLHQIINRQSTYYEMFIEGVVSVSQGENPKVLQNKLSNYLS